MTCSGVYRAMSCRAQLVMLPAPMARAAFGGQHLTAQYRSRSLARGSIVVHSEQVDFKDRAVAALPYLVPLFDGIRYGAYQ